MSLQYPSDAYDPNIAGAFAQSERGGNLTSEYPNKQKKQGGGSSVPYAAIIGAAMQLIQGNKSRQAEAFARVESEHDKMNLLKGVKQARGIHGVFSGLEEAELKTGQRQELGGFQGAKKGLELGAIQAQQGVAARGKVNQASLEQNIVSRGLLGTSTGVQALGGLQDRTSLQLSAIDQALAQNLGQLGQEQAQLEGLHGRERSGLQARRGAQLQEFALQEAALQPGKKKKKQKRWQRYAEGFISGGASELFGSQISGPETEQATLF